MDDALTVTVTRTEKDHWAILDAARQQGGKPGFLSFAIALVAIVGPLIVGSYSVAFFEKDSPGPAIILFGGWILSFTIVWLHDRKYFRWNVKVDSPPERIWLADDGIHDESERARRLLFWSAVKSVIETRKHVVIMLAPNEGVVLPKRCFASQANINAFVAEVRRRITPPHGEGAT